MSGPFLFGDRLTATLGSLIAQQAPPPNPQTPQTRANPEHEWYVALQCIRRTTEDAQEKASERGPEIAAILDAIRTSCSRLLAGVDPKVVAASMASLACAPVAPPLSAQLQSLAATMSAPPSTPGVGGAPGLVPGASPFGTPPLGGMPAGGVTGQTGPAAPTPGAVPPPQGGF